MAAGSNKFVDDIREKPGYPAGSRKSREADSSWELRISGKQYPCYRNITPARPMNSTRLTMMHNRYIFMHMRTTLNIDDQILEKASKLTGVKEKTALVRLGLEALIARESAKRLAKLGGTEDNLRPIPRRRTG